MKIVYRTLPNREIIKLAAEMAEHINENKSPDDYTIVCRYEGLLSMVKDRIGEDADLYEATDELFNEMQYEHNMFLEVSQFSDVVLDEREEEF